MAELTSAIISKSVASLLNEAGKRFWSHWNRIASVREAYQNPERSHLKHSVVRTALDDITRAIGQDGKYNEQVADFLDGLGKSNLLDRICLAAVTGVQARGTFAAFELLFEQHFSKDNPIGLSAESLYEHLQAMARASILNNKNANEYFAQEALRTLRESVAAQDLSLKAQFVLTKANGEEVSRSELFSERPWLKQDPDVLHRFLGQLGQALYPLFDKIRVEGPAMRSIEVPGDEIYVEPQLIAYKLGPAERQQPSLLHSVGVDAFLETLTRAAIIGDPGGGKSTLVRMVCRQLLKRPTGLPFPIFVTLRKYYAARKSQSNLSLLDYLLQELCEQSNKFSAGQLRNPILNILSYGHALVIFDGLDEIISVGQRRDIATSIAQFCSTYNLCRYIVTSRRIDYQQVSVSNFQTLELAPFDNDGVKKYVGLSAKNVFHRDASQVQNDVARFMEVVNRNASEFKSNPLLLSLIVWLFNSTQRIPDNRAEIYEECSRLLFERWDSLREISSEVPDAHRLFALLSYLASKMYLDPDLQGGATKLWLSKAIKDYFVSDYTDNAESRALNASNKFLEHLSGRAWVLRAVGSDQYEFTHRTFMEYFFAKYLNDKHLSLDSLMDELAPRIKGGEWNVPAHLAIQISVGGKRNHSEHAVHRLVDLHQSTTATEAPVVAEFIAQATEYLQPSETGLENVAKIVTLEVRNDETWKKAFISVLQTPNEMRGAIFRGLAKGFADLVSKGSLHRIAFVLDWLKACELAQINLFDVDIPPRLQAFTQSHTFFASELVPEVSRIEDDSAAACKASFDLGGDFDEKLVSRFGFRLWLSSSDLPLERLDWRGIDFASMLIELSQVIAGTLALEKARYARLAIALSKSDFTSPISITKAPIVVARPKKSYGPRLVGTTPPNPVLAAAVAFAAMALDEMPGPWRFSEAKACVRNSLQVLPSGKMADFARRWLEGKVQLFQPPPPNYRQIEIDGILR